MYLRTSLEAVINNAFFQGFSSSVYKCNRLGDQNDENLVVKVSNDEGDGVKFDSLKLEHKILMKLQNCSASYIVKMEDYFEDSQNPTLNYIVL